MGPRRSASSSGWDCARWKICFSSSPPLRGPQERQKDRGACARRSSVVYAAVSAVEVRPLLGRGRLRRPAVFLTAADFWTPSGFNRRGLDRILGGRAGGALWHALFARHCL
ncbi:MAG: hypothetical protein ACLUEQ_00280 [Cloacibacillus evryensis]